MSDQGNDPQQQPVQPQQYPPPPVQPPFPQTAPQDQPAQPEQSAPPQQPVYQPPAYQPQPPAYPAAQQPQHAPPAYGQPAAPLEPPKKRGKGGIVALVIAIVVLCGLIRCGAIGFALFTAGSSGPKDIQQAETHFDSAVTAVGAANTSLATLSSGDQSAKEIGTVVVDASASIKTARDEITAAKTIAEQWPDSQGKADYLAGLTASTTTLDALQELIAYMDTATGMLAKAKQGGEQSSSGLTDLNAAINAGNSNKFSTMRSKGQAAQTHFIKAAMLFREAHQLDKSAGLDKSARYADLRKKQADVTVRMAAEGSARRYSAYNADIKKLAALGRDAEKVGSPAIVSDSKWAEKRLAELEKTVTEASDKADTLRKQALTALGYTQ